MITAAVLSALLLAVGVFLGSLLGPRLNRFVGQHPEVTVVACIVALFFGSALFGWLVL